MPVDPEAAERLRAVKDRTYRIAEQLSSRLREAADTLERSATLADAHARRREQAGQHPAAARERLAAQSARKAAQRARARAWQLTEQARREAATDAAHPTVSESGTTG